MSEKSQESSETMDTTLEEESSIAVSRAMQMLSDFLEYTSKLRESNGSIYTELYPKLEEIKDQMNYLSLCIAETIANGSRSLISMTSSKSIQRQACPIHYKTGTDFESIDFIDRVLLELDSSDRRLTPIESYCIMNALKYTNRAGKKGPWTEDARKCADYIKRALDGRWLSNDKG